MCHAYQLIPYCSGPFPMQRLWCRWGSSLQSGWKHKRGCAFCHRRQPRVKPGSHLPTLWDLSRLLSLLCTPAEMNIMFASIHLMGSWYVLKKSKALGTSSRCITSTPEAFVNCMQFYHWMTAGNFPLCLTLPGSCTAFGTQWPSLSSSQAAHCLDWLL